MSLKRKANLHDIPGIQLARSHFRKSIHILTIIKIIRLKPVPSVLWHTKQILTQFEHSYPDMVDTLLKGCVRKIKHG